MNVTPSIDRPAGDARYALAAFAAALMILALPAHFAGTLALILIGAIVAWFAPAVMVATVLITVPMQDQVILPFVIGELTLTQIALFSLALGWGAGFWRRTIWLDGVTWWFLAILGALLLSLIAVDEFGNWAGEVYRWAATIVFYLIARSVLRDWESIRIALWAMVIAVSGVAAYGIGQVVAQNGPEHMVRGGVLRVFGPFGTPNPFAAYIEFTVPLLLALVFIGLHRDIRHHIGTSLWLGMGVASAMGFAIIALTQSRGGWVGFGLAMFVLLWVLPRRWRLVVFGAGAVLIGLMLLTPPGQSQVGRFDHAWKVAQRNGSLSTAVVKVASTGREPLWGAAIGMLEDEPLTGIGAGEFDYHYREYTPDWQLRIPLGQAHNGYLHMAAQAGIVGAITFTGWLIAMLVSLAGAARRSVSPIARALAVGGLATVVAFGVHSVVDYLNVLSLGLQLGAVVALGLSVSPNSLPETEPRAQRKVPSMPLQAGNA